MQDFAFEKSYWGDCCNTFEEDIKHYTYARLMGLTQHRWSFIVGAGYWWWSDFYVAEGFRFKTR